MAGLWLWLWLWLRLWLRLRLRLRLWLWLRSLRLRWRLKRRGLRLRRRRRLRVTWCRRLARATGAAGTARTLCLARLRGLHRGARTRAHSSCFGDGDATSGVCRARGSGGGGGCGGGSGGGSGGGGGGDGGPALGEGGLSLGGHEHTSGMCMA